MGGSSFGSNSSLGASLGGPCSGSTGDPCLGTPPASGVVGGESMGEEEKEAGAAGGVLKGHVVYRPWIMTALQNVFASTSGDPSPSSRVLCVVGPAGCGKSTLMAVIAAHGKQKRPEYNSSGHYNIAVAAYHFCIAGDSLGHTDSTSPGAFVRNIAAQFCSSAYMAVFREHVAEHTVEVLTLTLIGSHRRGPSGLRMHRIYMRHGLYALCTLS